jgi:diacylglycerol kinase (ATP)
MARPPGPNRPWWPARLASFGHAWAGLRHTARSQPNFAIELVLGAVALMVAVWLRAGLVPVLLCCGLVLSLEVLNTAIEALTDLVSPEWHPQAKVAKDAAAGAVLLASLASVGVGLLVLGPALWARLVG